MILWGNKDVALRMIFIDDNISNVRRIAGVVSRINREYFRYRSEVQVVHFGMDKKNCHSQYSHERFRPKDYSDFKLMFNLVGVPEDGIAIQEWLNHRELYGGKVNNICIISNRDMRPLNDYVVRPGFMLGRKVKKMLETPYKNKTAYMQDSLRKLF